MIAVFIVPTGIGAEIGGHAGDACPSARLIAGVCDTLITHPNVVNASDINEMTENMLYVEGSTLDRLLEGKLGLRRVKGNRILLAINQPVSWDSINAASAARACLGAEIKILKLKTTLSMYGKVENGKAGGTCSGVEELIEQVRGHDFDALGIATDIMVDKGVALEYFRHGGVNPWGGIEALVSRQIAEALNKPVAHAPIESDATKANLELLNIMYNEAVDPRQAAEAISACYVHCILKGLHKAPRIGSQIQIQDIDVMISPDGCFGRPHRACLEQGIPVIVVEENRTTFKDEMPSNFIKVRNYLEAAGVVAAIKEGIALESVKRPLLETPIISF